MIKGFVSYAHDDVAMVREFLQDLKGIEHDYPISFWIDDNLRAGDAWKHEIKTQIDQATIFLLLMSRAFLASDFIRETEWGWIRAREVAVGGRVILVVLEPCGWTTTWGKYQAAPSRDGKLVEISNWRRHGDGYNAAAERLRETLRDKLELQPKERPEPAYLRAVPQDPAGYRWFKDEDQFKIESDSDETDEAVANVGDTRRRQERLAARVEAVRSALENHPPEEWSGTLAEDLRAMSALLSERDGPLWPRITEFHDYIRAVSADAKRARGRIEARDNRPALPAALVEDLETLAMESSFFARQFPAVRRTEDRATTPENLATMLANAPALIEDARSCGIVTTPDAARVRRVLQEQNTPEEDRHRAALGVRNLLNRVGAFAVGFIPNPVVPGRAEDDRVRRNVERFLRNHGDGINAFFVGSVTEIGRSYAGLIDIVRIEGLHLQVATPTPPPAPPPDFDMAVVEAMIVRGETPPRAWWPFVLSLNLPFSTMLNDLTPLAGMTALQSLNLLGTSVSDLTPLAGMTALQSLVLQGTSVSDLTPLAGMTALQSLVLQGTSVSDLTPLAGMTALQSLDLRDTSVSDLTPLAGLTALQRLNLRGTSVSDLTPLAGLTALQSLVLQGTSVSDLTPLAGLTALQSLDLQGTRVSDLTPLTGLAALQSLVLRRTRVTDLTPLAGLTALQNLDLTGTAVNDLTPLAGLAALQSLYLQDMSVSDLAPLSRLTALQSLDLSGTGVRDLAVLGGLTALQSLDLRETRVSDLAPLAGLTALQHLYLTMGPTPKGLDPLRAYGVKIHYP
jgi:Leucine-rich repeat (LRR) protein